MKRDVRVAGVVRDDGAEELDVFPGERGGAVAVLAERLHELVVDLRRPPGQQSVLLHHVLAVLLDGRLVVSRQIREGIRPVAVHVQEVARRLFEEPRVAPQVRVDRVLDDHGAVLLEERPKLRGQQLNRPPREKTMDVEAPGAGGHQEPRRAARPATCGRAEALAEARAPRAQKTAGEPMWQHGKRCPDSARISQSRAACRARSIGPSQPGARRSRFSRSRSASGARARFRRRNATRSAGARGDARRADRRARQLSD